MRRQTWRLVLLLVVAGLVLTLWRYLTEPVAAAAPGDRLWDVELRITADAGDGKVAVDVAVPLNTRYLRVVGQNTSHRDWRQRFSNSSVSGAGRRISYVSSRPGRLNLEAVFTVHASATPRIVDAGALTPLGAELQEASLADHTLLQIDDPVATGLVAELGMLLLEGDTLPDAIYDKVRSWSERGEGTLLDVPGIIAEGRANRRERAYAMVALCRAARIPARLVKGIILKESPQTALHFWVEVHRDGRWVAYDPVYGYRQDLPASYLPFAKGLVDVVSVSGSTDFSYDLSIANTDQLLDLAESTRQNWVEMLTLTRLPLDTRIMLAALLLLPFGVLLTAFFNDVVGVHSYGVFTPTLLALSLVYVPWQSAAVLLAVVLLVGVVGRSLLPAKLNRAPRLAIVVTLVALGVATSASVMDFAQIGFGGQLILLPIVVLASLVDRFYSVFDQRGLRTAVMRLVWTLLLAASCIPIVQLEALGHFLLRFPELHLVTLAAIVALSQYAGRRFADLPWVPRWLYLERSR